MPASGPGLSVAAPPPSGARGSPFVLLLAYQAVARGPGDPGPEGHGLADHHVVEVGAGRENHDPAPGRVFVEPLQGGAEHHLSLIHI